MPFRSTTGRAVWAGHRGVDLDLGLVLGVEDEAYCQLRSVRFRRRAEQSGVTNGHGAGGVDGDRLPDATGVTCRGEMPGLKRSGERGFWLITGLIRAGHLNRQKVVFVFGEQVGDIKPVGGKVGARVADVAPVEPDLASAEDTIKAEPEPFIINRLPVAEPPTVEEWTVVIVKIVCLTPVTRDLDLGPAGIVEVGVGSYPFQAEVHGVGPPTAVQIALVLMAGPIVHPANHIFFADSSFSAGAI